MELKLESATVVVLSQGNNPKLLNPDFLERHRVVPTDWKAKDVLVTPPVAQVTYENGIRFTVEMNKLQVEAARPNAVDWKRVLPEAVNTYLSLLPHVSYGAVGVNFVFRALGCPDCGVTRLLKKGPWLDKAGGLTGSMVELHYQSASPYMNVKIWLQRENTPADSDENLLLRGVSRN